MSGNIVVRINDTKKPSIANVKVQNDQLIVTGKNLDSVTLAQVAGYEFQIESKTSDKLILNAKTTLSFLVGSALNLVVSNANASATFPLSFELQNGQVTASKLHHMGASTGDFLQFNGATWEPASLNTNQVYVGTYNAATDTPNISTAVAAAGTYYIVTTAGAQDLGTGLANYDVGDWVISDGTNWSKVSVGTNTVSNFNGRTGAVVPLSGDYSWSMLTKAAGKLTGSKLQEIADIDAAGVQDGDILQWNGGTLKWEVNAVPAPVISAGSISNTQIANGAVDSNKIVDGTIVNADISATAAIDQSKINGLTTDLNNKEPKITAGTAAQYWSGTKTWQNLNPAVIGSTLTGYAASAGVITAADSIVSAFNKLSGNLGVTAASQANYVLKAGDTMGGPLAMGNNKITGLGTPTVGTDAATKDYVDTKAGTASQWVTNGTDISYSAGNVGINTTTPLYKLDVEGSVQFGKNSATSNNVLFSMHNLYQGMTRFTTDANANYIQSGLDSTSNSAKDFRIGPMLVNTAWLSIVGASGNVGIGTNSPLAKLSVNGDITVGLAKNNDDAVAGDNWGNRLYFSGAPDFPAWDGSNSDPIWMARANTGNDQSELRINVGDGPSTTDKFVVGTGSVVWNPLFAVVTNGNVGIGTTDPLEKLSVIGNVALTGGVRVKSDTTNYVELRAPDGLGANLSFRLPASLGTSGYALITDGAGNLSWSAVAGTPADGSITYSKLNLADGDIPLAKLNGASDVTKYLKGNKTWGTFITDVLASTFATVTPSNTAIANGDSLQTVVNKAQGQINNLASNSLNKTGADSVTGTLTINPATGALKIPATPSGVDLTDAANVQYVQNYVSNYGQWTKNPTNISYAGNVGIGTSTNVGPAGIEAQLKILRQLNKWGLMIEGDGTNQSDILLNTPNNTANNRVAQIVNAQDKFIFRALNDDMTQKTQLMTMLLNSGYVGIGSTAPESLLHLLTKQSASPIPIGSEASILLQSDPTLPGIQGYVGSLWFGSRDTPTEGSTKAAGIVGYMAEDVTATSAPADLLFMTTPTGSLTALERMKITSAGNVGIGTTAPGSKLVVSENASSAPIAFGGRQLHIVGADGANAGIQIDGIGTNAGTRPVISFRQAGGTGAAPTSTMANDVLGSLGWWGRGATDYSNTQRAEIRVDASQNWTDTAQGTVMIFKTTASGSTTNNERMRIENNGNVGIANSAPNSKLDVYAGLLLDGKSALNLSATGVAPVSGTLGSSQMTFNPISHPFGSGPRYVNLAPASTIDGHGISISSGYTEFYSNQNFAFFVRPNRADINGTYTSTEVMRIDNTGNVGIGIAAAGYKLHVNGAVAGVGAYNALSDRRYKKDFEKIPDALERVVALNGFYYQWRQDEHPDLKFEKGRDMGVIAQEVQKVFPEAVSTDKKSGIMSVAYSKLIAPIIEAIKELFTRSEKHEREIASLKEENRLLKESLCEVNPKAKICRK